MEAEGAALAAAAAPPANAAQAEQGKLKRQKLAVKPRATAKPPAPPANAAQAEQGKGGSQRQGAVGTPNTSKVGMGLSVSDSSLQCSHSV